MTNSVPESVWYNFAADDIASASAIREFEAWKAAILQGDRLRALGQFVAQEMGGGRTATYVENKSGSYNIVFRFRLDDGKELALRLPTPRRMVPALVVERLENEVSWMQYFEEHAIAKVPHVHSWSVSAANAIGHPFILMDFVGGEPLYDCILSWFRAEDRSQRTPLMTTLYRDLAALYVLSDTPGAATDGWPTGPLDSVSPYKDFVDLLHHTQQDGLRTINIPGRVDDLIYEMQQGDAIDMERAMKTARGRVLARHSMQDAASLAFFEEEDDADQDGRPFRIFNPDMSVRNILVDPKTGHIAALIDFEYTNAMPAALAHSPPLFILPHVLTSYLIEGKFDEFLQNYKIFFPFFANILEEVEKNTALSTTSVVPLSAKMQTSFKDMSWLVRFAYSHVDMADMIYWEQRDLFPLVNEDGLEAETRAYQEHTKRQIASFRKDTE
ncbi:Protein kinase-like domain protein [Niveomyces insectorum RCEF 264]|uniref:Protein kinase-like domain protein n=1 Tax=Niveomyces insectorum RCEF 264 TaxID=1081102 RepID=A0A167NH93_9HYPO|nr:Protein kinase-like domain protein [Niveomyces insectorum RCEF 264]